MPKHVDPTAFTMSFGDHLEDLRRRLFLALVFPLPAFIVLFLVSDTLIEWMLLPAYRALERAGLPPEMQVLSPPEFIMAQLKLSLIGALVLGAPWILYQAWCFISPGLYTHERRFVYVLIPGSAILTTLGVALLYFVMLPIMMHVLIMFGANMSIDLSRPPDEKVAAVLAATPDIEVRNTAPELPVAGDAWLLVPEMIFQVAVPDDDPAAPAIVVDVPRAPTGRLDQRYRVSFVIDFTLMLLLGIVVAFQLPLVMLLAGWIGIIRAKDLRAGRRYALLICGVASALLTPSDVVSMCLMLIPLYGLYELGILFVHFLPARRVAEGLAVPVPSPVEGGDIIPRGREGDVDDDPGMPE